MFVWATIYEVILKHYIFLLSGSLILILSFLHKVYLLHFRSLNNEKGKNNGCTCLQASFMLSLYFVAVKSNDDPALIHVLHKLGTGFDCASRVCETVI